MNPQQAANDSPYWPACMCDPGFLPWLSRFMAIVTNTRNDTPTHAMVRMAQKHGPVPPDWGLAVQFLMEHTHPR
jgi:hypothetical protein